MMKVNLLSLGVLFVALLNPKYAFSCFASLPLDLYSFICFFVSFRANLFVLFDPYFTMLKYSCVCMRMHPSIHAYEYCKLALLLSIE